MNSLNELALYFGISTFEFWCFWKTLSEQDKIYFRAVDLRTGIASAYTMYRLGNNLHLLDQ